jgi:Arc/MetJ-type ribon-helix-helix transcriptional regulator
VGTESRERLLAAVRYRLRVDRQVAIRLPEELVAFVDEMVETGAASSRAAVVTRALERERRRRAAQRDAEIMDPDLDSLAEWASRNMPALD